MLKIAIIKEYKHPADKRAALTPNNCALLLKTYPNQLEIFVESSTDRIFTDKEYKKVGCFITTDVSNVDLLFGVKEVPSQYLVPNKTYFFFSHTIKQQAYNQAMFHAMIAKNITLIDYETLAKSNNRILGFGYHAGVVGAYNGLLTYGKKSGLFNLKPVHTLENYQQMVLELSNINFPPISIALTGGGRVASGALKLLKDAGIPQVNSETYLHTSEQLQFVHLSLSDIYSHNEGKPFDQAHFYANHKEYHIQFEAYYEKTDVMINGIYWAKDMPVFFKKEETGKANFNISVIADVSCDVEGSIPITYKATTIAEPVIGWDKVSLTPCAPYQENCISIMAVSNLPCELPKDASELFGSDLVTKVFPEIMKEQSTILKNATILQNGELTEKYQYLQSYAHTDIITK